MNNGEFYVNGYKIIKLSIPYNDLWEYCKNQDELKTGDMSDKQAINSQSWYKDNKFNVLQKELLPLLEEEINLQLLPTYNYWRMYYTGSYLKVHTDRPACEISISLTIGYESDYIWPLYLNDREGNPIKCELDRGYALLYKGTILGHWRPIFKGKRHAQVFFHYVDKYGYFSAEENDQFNPDCKQLNTGLS